MEHSVGVSIVHGLLGLEKNMQYDSESEDLEDSCNDWFKLWVKLFCNKVMQFNSEPICVVHTVRKWTTQGNELLNNE